MKVARECDEPLQEVHDLPESMFGLESYEERVETWVELGKLFFFKECMGAQRYMAIFKEPSLFGSLWGKLLI